MTIPWPFHYFPPGAKLKMVQAMGVSDIKKWMVFQKPQVKMDNPKLVGGWTTHLKNII